MAADTKRLLEIASSQIGYSEYPANSNKTKYGKWFGLDGMAWCGIFVSWVFAQAGMSLGSIGFTKGFAGCQTAVAFFRKNKRIIKDPVPGCIVFYDWNGDGRYDHTGIFVRKIDEKTFVAIEGNTSMTNQSNGGTVMERIRPFSVSIFAKPACLD